MAAGLILAQCLAGLETCIGITPEQAFVWRNDTDALIAFVEADQSPPRLARTDTPAANRPQNEGPELPPRLMALASAAAIALASLPSFAQNPARTASPTDQAQCTVLAQDGAEPLRRPRPAIFSRRRGDRSIVLTQTAW